MGSGRWDHTTYASSAALRSAKGISDFDYSDRMLRSTPRSAWKVHADLDPFNVTVRESRDSDEHPTSVAVSVLFDVTGSMSRVPRQLQQELPKLHGLLEQGGYVEDAQILFGAIGDATCDRIPLQVGQFESDNRMDENLMNIVLEGGGGGQNTESYELALYFMARHTAIDCQEKRGEKGFLFIIGDELPYDRVKSTEVAQFVGGGIQEDIPFEDILAEVQAKYELYWILPESTSHGRDQIIRDFWGQRLGDHLLIVPDVNDVCETIGMTIAKQRAANDLAAIVAKADEDAS